MMGKQLLLVILIAVLPLLPVAKSECGGMFAFGDSNTDTGGHRAGTGSPVILPYGRLFHGGTTSGRLSDGRVIIDFLCESLKMGYLNPYLEALGTDFTNGANFAISGARTRPKNVPFALFVQVQQFLHFKSRSLELGALGLKGLFDEEGFKKALYLIDIGQNDLHGAFSPNLDCDEVIRVIPLVLSEIKDAIKTLYDNGAKFFWIHGTGPLGCLPGILELAQNDEADLAFDQHGCLADLNNAAKKFNDGLSSLCNELGHELNNSTIVYTDLYAIKYDLIANYTKYGFDSPLTPCIDWRQAFGGSNSEACNENSSFISWDGIHYTEAANFIVASKILSTEFSKPKFKFDYFCDRLDVYMDKIYFERIRMTAQSSSVVCT